MYRQGRDCVITVNDQVQRFPDIVVSSDRNDLGKLLILMIYRKLDFSVILLIQISWHEMMACQLIFVQPIIGFI